MPGNTAPGARLASFSYRNNHPKPLPESLRPSADTIPNFLISIPRHPFNQSSSRKEHTAWWGHPPANSSITWHEHVEAFDRENSSAPAYPRLQLTRHYSTVPVNAFRGQERFYRSGKWSTASRTSSPWWRDQPSPVRWMTSSSRVWPPEKTSLHSVAVKASILQDFTLTGQLSVYVAYLHLYLRHELVKKKLAFFWSKRSMYCVKAIWNHFLFGPAVQFEPKPPVLQAFCKFLQYFRIKWCDIPVIMCPPPPHCIH
jgi:hypothetical protein